MNAAGISQAARATPATPIVAHVSGAGDNVILIHGGRGSHTHWAKNIDTLARHYRVYALDLPGFGEAPDVPRGINADGYLALVHTGVDSLIGDQPAAIVGFSFGGAIAADLCRRLGPRCSKLALLGPGGFGEAKGRTLDLRPAPAAIQADPHYRAVVRHNLLAMMLHNTDCVDESTVDIQCQNIARSRYNSLKVSLRPTLLGDIAAVSCPLLMIWGKNDRVAFPSAETRAAECKAVRPDIKLSIIPGAGHWVQYEAAAVVNDLLLRFLRDN